MTGAAGSIGRAYVEALLARGASVVANDIRFTDAPRDDAPDYLASFFADAAGGRLAVDAQDVRTGAEATVAGALERFGRLDAVVNNAGIWRETPIALDDGDFRAVFSTHFDGTMAVTSAAWPHLAANAGHIVQTSSAGIFGGSRSIAYPIAKAAVLGTVTALRDRASSDGITINAVLPVASSEMMDSALDDVEVKARYRRLSPAAVAEFVVLLCHEACPFNGFAFDVGGGHVARVVHAENRGVVCSTAEEYLSAHRVLTDSHRLSHCADAKSVMEEKLKNLPIGAAPGTRS